jgi:hypothetical protein
VFITVNPTKETMFARFEHEFDELLRPIYNRNLSLSHSIFQKKYHIILLIFINSSILTILLCRDSSFLPYLIALPSLRCLDISRYI